MDILASREANGGVTICQEWFASDNTANEGSRMPVTGGEGSEYTSRGRAWTLPGNMASDSKTDVKVTKALGMNTARRGIVAAS